MDTNLSIEFMAVDGVCGLCAGTGVIDTSLLRSPAGVFCGGVMPCICAASSRESSRPEHDLWLDLRPCVDGLCGLCGNYGIVDLVDARRAIGIRAFCICPNGRAMKRAGASLARWPSSRDDWDAQKGEGARR